MTRLEHTSKFKLLEENIFIMKRKS